MHNAASFRYISYGFQQANSKFQASPKLENKSYSVESQMLHTGEHGNPHLELGTVANLFKHFRRKAGLAESTKVHLSFLEELAEQNKTTRK